MFRAILNRGKRVFRRLILAMVFLILISEVEAVRVLVIDRFVEFEIGMQVKIAILMALLTYDSFNDYKSFRLKHLRNGLSRCWALRVCKED